ncbi:hypothetical protein BJ912DRAFT_453464 [Pholiota molesta]|nr:hypothetical protein BJ912DRAFT_453464 [Pholiota molesta]
MTGRNPPCPKIAKGQPCTPCEALAVIEQEISKTENRHDVPQAKHSLLYSQINHSHDPLTSKLPVEIVTKIFTNFLPIDVDTNYGPCVKSSNYRYFTTPLVLGAVCAAWRSIAWSTPQLWASISVDLVGNNETRLNIVREWLHRSGELPLYIGIHNDNNYINDDFTGATLNTLASYSHRWFYLVFNISARYFWLYMVSRLNLANALMLNTLQIRRSSPQGLDLGMIPNLKNLYAITLSGDTLLNIDWTKLTNVITSFRYIDMCLKLFSNAPLLTHCEFTLNTVSWDGMGTTPDAIRHKHLVYLNITVLKSTVPIGMALSWIEFPALRHLVVSSQAIQIDLDAIRDLLLRSHCSLETLEMDLTPHTYELFDAPDTMNPFL